MPSASPLGWRWPACLSVFLAACTSLPRIEPEATLRARAIVRQESGLTVRSTPLSRHEDQALLARAAPRRVIQPIWVEVENDTRSPVWFLPVGISRDYFPPDEVAFRNHARWRHWLNPSIDDWYREKSMPKLIPAGARRTGLVFAPAAPGTLAWNIELLGGRQLHRFAFAAKIPGFRADFDLADLEERAAAKRPPLDWPGLRGVMEKSPPCATDRRGRRSGDPLNIVVVGSFESVLEVSIRNGWKLAEPVTVSSAVREATAVLTGGGYPTGPVSPMYLDGRREDLALQRPRPSARRRHHMRLWLSEWRCEGQPVWIGQISRDIGVRLTRHTWNLTTHRVAADVDESRDNLVAEAISTQSVRAVGWVGGVGEATSDQPRRNLTGDPYFTDGLRAVLFLSSSPVPTAAVRRLPGSRHPFRERFGGL